MNTNEKNHIRILILKLIHFGLTLITFYIAWLLFRYHTLNVQVARGFRYNYFVLLGYGALLLFFNRAYNSYLLGYARIRMNAFMQFLSQFFSVVLIYFAVSIGWNKFHNPLVLLLSLGVQVVIDIIWSYYANWYYFKLNPARKTILIYRNAMDKKRFGSIHGKPSERLYQITKEYKYQGDRFEDVEGVLEGFDAVFVTGVNSRCRNGILKYCKMNNIPGFFLPHVGDVLMQEAEHIQAFDSPVLYINKTVIKPEYAFVKRMFDIVSSFCGIVVLSPIMLLTALAIKMYDGGPAIYKQVRLTKDEKEFEIYKFRSMRVDAEKDGVARLSTGDKDDRITPIGKFVRKCRLDELPQLFNILKGDMSVVGPRPERPEIAKQYYETLPAFRLRLQVKAGLTGYAQIYGKYNTEPYEKLEFDLLYINHMSVFTDLKLIFATIAVLFMSDSTEGIKEGSVTAMSSEESEEAIDYDEIPELDLTGEIKKISDR